jgi:hypothetical protein
MMEGPVLIAAAGIMAIVIMTMIKLRYGFTSGRRTAAPAPPLKSGRIIVTGLGMTQVQTILAEFAGLHDLDAQILATSPAGDATEVRWTRPITSDIALFLVNYLTYPGDQQRSGAQPRAVGVIAVPPDIAPECLAPGTLTKIFVPEGDTEFDLVHAFAADGRAFRISFTRMKWEPISSPKAPALAGKAAFALEG